MVRCAGNGSTVLVVPPGKKEARELIPLIATSPGTLVRYIPSTLISWIRISVVLQIT